MEETLAFYRYYAKKANGPVLELNSGTGEFLLPLLEEGFNIHGLENVDYLFKTLNTNAKAKNFEPKIWKSSIEDFKSPEKYNLIFCTSSFFMAHLVEVDQAIKTLYEHLNKGGILLFFQEFSLPYKEYRTVLYECKK